MDREQPFIPAPVRLAELRSEALRQTLRQDWRCHLFVLLWALTVIVLVLAGEAKLLWMTGMALAGWVGLGAWLSQPRFAAALQAERERSEALSEVGKAIQPGWR